MKTRVPVLLAAAALRDTVLPLVRLGMLAGFFLIFLPARASLPCP